MCLTYLALVPANVYFQSVSGTGNTRTALVLELSSLTIYTAYITWTILFLRLDVALCWSADIVYGIFILLFCRIYLRKGNWTGRQI